MSSPCHFASSGRLLSINKVDLPKPTGVWLDYLILELQMPIILAVEHIVSA
jgi:hypothetical protein